MNKYLESAMIALDAIWSAKLRSFMTVLGNIVAVTSIIAVVSLIQGLNASVKSAILNQAGADSFNIQQFPITRSDEEFDKIRGNPRVPVAVIGGQTADRLFGSDVDPIDKTIQIEGVHFRVVGVSAKRGSLLGQTQDEFAIMPLGQFRMIFGSRRSLSLSVRPRDLAQIAP